MARDLISVIVIAFNTAPYIRQCLDSLVYQTYSNMEIIVVESCSTDGTDAIADEFAGRYPERVKVMHTPKLGLGNARNTGLDNARGKYIGFVDSDDWVEEDMFERLHRTIESNDSDLAICDYDIHFDLMPIGTNGPLAASIAKIRAFYFDIGHNHISGMDDDGPIETKRGLIRSGTGAVWNKLFSKELIKGKRFPEDVVPEDIGFTIFSVINAKRISHVGSVLYHYRHRETSTLGNMRSEKQDYFQFFDSVVRSRDIVMKENPDYLEPFYDRAARVLFSGRIDLVHSIEDPSERRKVALKWANILNDTVPCWYERPSAVEWTVGVKALDKLVGHYRDRRIDDSYDELVRTINSRPYRLTIATLRMLKEMF